MQNQQRGYYVRRSKLISRPLHNLYAVLFFGGLVLVWLRLVAAMSAAYSDSVVYGAVGSGLFNLSVVGAMTGGIHVFRAYWSFGEMEHDMGQWKRWFPRWVDTRIELALRAVGVVSMVAAFSKASDLWRMVAMVGSELGFSMSAGKTCVVNEGQCVPVDSLADGSEFIGFGILVAAALFLWSFCALWSTRGGTVAPALCSRRVSFWCATDFVALVFWIFCFVVFACSQASLAPYLGVIAVIYLLIAGYRGFSWLADILRQRLPRASGG